MLGVEGILISVVGLVAIYKVIKAYQWMVIHNAAEEVQDQWSRRINALNQLKCLADRFEFRSLQKSLDYDAIGLFLGKVMEDDPVVSWLYEPRHRVAQAGRVYADEARVSTVLCCKKMPDISHPPILVVWDKETQQIAAASVWFAPDCSPDSVAYYRYLLPLDVPFSYGFSTAKRLVQISNEMDVIHDELMGKRKHWYLGIIGVDTQYRGQRLASVMMDYILQRADEEQVEVYLENSKEKNISFYERFGFRVRKTVAPADCPPMQAMVRQPMSKRLSESE